MVTVGVAGLADAGMAFPVDLAGVVAADVTNLADAGVVTVGVASLADAGADTVGMSDLADDWMALPADLAGVATIGGRGILRSVPTECVGGFFFQLELLSR